VPSNQLHYLKADNFTNQHEAVAFLREFAKGFFKTGNSELGVAVVVGAPVSEISIRLQPCKAVLNSRL
jgi:hypothetical protein